MGTAVLTGRDMSVLTYEPGGVVDGTPTWGTAVNLKCYCESYQRTAATDAIDVTARCDSNKAELPTVANVGLRLTLTVPPAGCLIPAGVLGQYGRIVMTEITAGETFTDIFYIKSNNLTSPKADKLTQELEFATTI